jgi:hypothetical protein
MRESSFSIVVSVVYWLAQTGASGSYIHVSQPKGKTKYKAGVCEHKCRAIIISDKTYV